MSRSWPGNVRELQNAIEYVAVMAEPGNLLEADDLPMRTEIGHGASSTKGWPTHLMAKTYHIAKEAVLAHFEKEYLAQLVTRADRNMSKAARMAGIDRTTLYRLLEKHHVAEESQPTKATHPNPVLDDEASEERSF
jgi:DNA-binding NtrC family response regulator